MENLPKLIGDKQNSVLVNTMPETDRKWNSAENKYKALVTQRCFMFGSSDTDFKIRNRNLLTIR